MCPDDRSRAASLRVAISDALGRPLRRPTLARWLQSVAPARARGDVTLALVGDADIRRLNRRYAGIDRPTDVLSFASRDSAAASCPPSRGPGAPRGGLEHLGDIVIALGVAGRQARAAGHSVETELRILALHGLLHLLGYDHAVDDGRMARLEDRLRSKAGLEEGLIDRARKAGGAARAGGASRPPGAGRNPPTSGRSGKRGRRRR